MVYLITGSAWLKITNDKIDDLMNEIDGRWIAFLTATPLLAPLMKRKTIANKINDIINEYGLREAYLVNKHYDILQIFTSADRDEILYVKEILTKKLLIRESNIYWTAEFELDKNFSSTKGKNFLLNEVYSAISYKEKYLTIGNKIKAERIDKKKVKPLQRKLVRVLMEEDIENRSSMVVKPLFSKIIYEIDPNIIFVLMPFKESWSDDVYHIIKQIGKELSLNIIRADDIFEPDIIINDIWVTLNKAGLIVADISVHNANVFYELGIAHTLGKKVVLLRQKEGQQSPFDVAFWRNYEYGLTPLKVDEFKDNLRKIFRLYIKNRKSLLST